MSQVVWSQEYFNAGKADDFFAVSASGFLSPLRVDIHESPRYVRSAARAVGVRTTDTPCTVLDISGAKYEIQEDGKIYRDNQLVYTSPYPGRVLVSAYYWAINWGLVLMYEHRVDFLNTQDFLAPVQLFGSMRENKDYRPIIEVYGDLYMFDGNQGIRIDRFKQAERILWQTPSSPELDGSIIPWGEVITSLTFNGFFLSIYGMKGQASSGAENFPWVDGVKYLWDMKTTAPAERMHWEDLPVHNALSAGDIDYVIAGRWSTTTGRRSVGLYKSAGREKQFVKILHDDYPSSYVGIERRCRWPMCIAGNVLRIGGYGGVYSWGSRVPWVPEGLSHECTAGTTDTEESEDLPEMIVNSLTEFGDGSLYLSASYFFNTALIHQVASSSVHIPTALRAKVSGFDTRPIDIGSLIETKSGIELSVGFDPLQSGQKIKVFYRTSIETAAFTLLKEITRDSHPDAHFARLPIKGNWRWVQIRIRTYASGDGSAPRVYELSLRQDDKAKY